MNPVVTRLLKQLLKKGDEKDSIDLFCLPDNPRSYINNGSFLHEGAEAAYNLARRHKGFPYSRDVGEFVGNLAQAEIMGRMPHHTQTFSGQEYVIINSMSLYELFLKELPVQVRNRIRGKIKRKAKRCNLPEHLVGLELPLEAGEEPYVSLIRYTRANDLIMNFRKGKEDPSLIEPFLNALVEVEDAYGLTIKEIFRAFKTIHAQD